MLAIVITEIATPQSDALLALLGSSGDR
jgi:hypothetical protein